MAITCAVLFIRAATLSHPNCGMENATTATRPFSTVCSVHPVLTTAALAVRDSQATTGQWFRSPRRLDTNNSHEPNSFSPDMALGAELFILATGSHQSGVHWLNWIADTLNCDTSKARGCSTWLPRFCTDASNLGCFLRPGDAAVLKAVMDYEVIEIPRRLSLYLTVSRAILEPNIWLSAHLNEPGYSQHLTGVELLILKKLGFNSWLLRDAAKTLARKNIENPFFQFLAEKGPKVTVPLTIKYCPAMTIGKIGQPEQWTWERADVEAASVNTMVWDCIFMAQLLKDKL